MNRVELTGRLARDPEIRYSNNGNSVANITVACDRNVKRGEEWVNEADFIRCVAYGRNAEFIEKYFHKGNFIVISGSIKTSSYQNQEGKTVYTTDVLIDKAEFGGNNGSAGNTGETSVKPNMALTDGFMNIPDGIDEELPFN